MDTPAIEAAGLCKRYGDADALAGVDLAVPAGTVCGLLGPNGAGKTTAVAVLATLTRPDGGTARVAGHDVVRSGHEVRRRIGLVGQHPAVDEVLGGRQNLLLFARLMRLDAGRARARADALLEQFGLADIDDRPVSAYSGGMRRRLDLAAAMILAPDVLFLDEPTTGLDPRGRAEVWACVRALAGTGTTVLLTTQYLEEADALADALAVLDRGRVVAAGTPDELKRRVAADRLHVAVDKPEELDRVAAIVGAAAGAPAEVDAAGLRVTAPTRDRVGALAAAARALADDGVAVADLGVRRPTLDEAFLLLTGTEAAA